MVRGRLHHVRAAALLCILGGCAGTATRAPGTTTFTNPVIQRDSPDPWAVRYGDSYYFTATLDPEGGVWVWRSSTLTGLEEGTKVRVWTSPASGPGSRMIWAPELHRLDGRWYLYYTASDGTDGNHREYVLAAKTDDPLGEYEAPVRVDPGLERYAIDGSVLRMPDGRLFFMYSTGELYIAPMSSPTRVSGPAVRIARGTEEWEHGWRSEGGEWVRDAGYWVEAPESLIHDGKVFVVYSAGHTATDYYYLGLLTLRGDDPLDPAAWTKARDPIFGPYHGPDGDVYAPGHNSFTRSPDGTQDWLVYHARDQHSTPSSPGGGFARRTTRIQPFGWKPDGTPDLGHPIPAGVELAGPSRKSP